ncbi:MAG: hypothetical protein V4482_05930, partial [Pseudomonadota bacterium]
ELLFNKIRLIYCVKWYNSSQRPTELQSWVNFMLEKAISEACPAVAACLTTESLEAFKTQYGISTGSEAV